MADTLIDLKRAFAENQLPDLERDLREFIDKHRILFALPERDRNSAAHAAATSLLLAIRSASIVGLVR
jgi:hypothetical protein